MILLSIFMFSQFLAFWRVSNIGTVLTGWTANFLSGLQLDGVVLLIVTLLLIAVIGLFNANMQAKWVILSPVVVSMFMQNNISAQYSQIVMRIGHTMTCGVTPFMAFYIIYLCYLNIYNQSKEKPIGLRKSMNFVLPYFLIMLVVWILLIVLWYIARFPIGPGVKAII